LAQWDSCVDPKVTPVINDRAMPVWVGVDASTKHDSTAIVAVTFEYVAQRVRLVWHRTFQPSPDEPLDFEAAIEGTLLDIASDFKSARCCSIPGR
jgi:hypothetical protein